MDDAVFPIKRNVLNLKQMILYFTFTHTLITKNVSFVDDGRSQVLKV